MRFLRTFLLIVLLGLGKSILCVGQPTISTTQHFYDTGGYGTVTFNMNNNNPYPMSITKVRGLNSLASTTVAYVYYKVNGVNNVPASISAADGWILAATDTFNSNGGGYLQTFLDSINVIIPANSKYGIAIALNVPGQPYYHMGPGGYGFQGYGMELSTGIGESFGGGIPPAPPTRSLSGWIGELTFATPLPCATPVVPGVATASPEVVCSGGHVTLGLAGASQGFGLTYQWQVASTATGPWTNMPGLPPNYIYYSDPTNDEFHRVILTCNSQSDTSVAIKITTKPILNGIYTINQNAPLTNRNFTSISGFADALTCGVSGPVVASVVAGSGPYNEQVKFISIPGASALNTVTLLGNGNLVTHASSDSIYRATVLLDFTSHLSINDLKIDATGIYRYGVQLYGYCDSNVIDGCTIDVGINTISEDHVPLVLSGNLASATSTGASFSNVYSHGNVFSNNELNGGYYGATLVGGYYLISEFNRFINNKVVDFYAAGLFAYYQGQFTLENNEFTSANRTTYTSSCAVILEGVRQSEIARNTTHDPFTQNTSTTSPFCAYKLIGLKGSVRFENNLIYNLNTAGSIRAFDIFNCRNFDVIHNTVSIANPTDTSSATTELFYIKNNSYDIILRNNIFSLTRGGTGLKHIYNRLNSGTPLPDNNVFHITSQNTVFAGGFNTQPTLAHWQAIYGLDLNSVLADPQFGPNSYVPTNAAMGNIGVALGTIKDYMYNLRSTTTPDPGCYEWPATLCAPPTGLAVTNISSGSISFSWDSSTAAAGYEYKIDHLNSQPSGLGIATLSPFGIESGLMSVAPYFLHVRINCGSSISAWVTLPFTTACSSQPSGLSVSGLNTQNPALHWNAMPQSLGFEYALDTLSLLPPPVGTRTIDTFAILNGVQYGATYYYYVRSRCDSSNFSAWTVDSFKIRQVNVPGVIGNFAKSIRIYPNPSNSNVSVEASIPVLITVTSMDGKLLISEKTSKQINIKSLSNGIYIIRVNDKLGNLLKVERLSKIN